MSLTLDEKKAVVAEVSGKLTGAQAAMLAEYRGLSVAQMTTLRRQAHESNVFLRVVKNSLARRAVEGTDFECLKDQMIGPLAFAVSADPVAVAKILSEFAKENEALKIKVGAMDGKLMSLAQIQALAILPGREQLLALLLGTLQAPVQKFVQTMNEVPAKFVRTLAAVRDAKTSAA
ncbi:MAG: 50S ribosomal protein L10 [Gammaproteobacteria bacterium]|nr:50S ribosomal protein L10 [Gammaproteobacteria bacterium]MDH3371049.1 50S ribosomal protein L10 [Gammaproteobacteria bacterium]MDH3406599.1 50S ribosomal protein L10 [Gammaproteobacteria bacterium]MDH5486203.1 50S ribosomal protein L10 [Gammaproteobacteria bacterium]